MTPSRPNYLGNIQILRFIAAVMVLFAHLLHETADHGLPMDHAIHDPTGIAWRTGVDVFFIVSGFIMYYLSHEQFGSWRNAADFLRRRFLRVAPMYWLFTGLMLVALALFHDRIVHTDLTPQTLIGSLLFFPVARADGNVFPVLAVGWTLDYEMFFYVCFALAMLLPRRIGLAALTVGFLALALVSRFIDTSHVALKAYSDPIIIEFLMGMLLAHLYLSGVALNRLQQWACIVVGAGLLVAMEPYQQLDRWIWGGLPAFAIAAGLALGPPVRSRWATIGGDASYALYLSHSFVLSLLAVVWAKARRPGNGWLYVVTGLVLCVLASVLVHRLVEAPMLKALRRRFEPARAQAIAAQGGP